MDGMVSRKRLVDGVPTSLCDLGYCDVGLDDGWQKCSTGQKHRFHDDEGNPVVDVDRFPDLRAMTTHSHDLGLTAGWYANNCICREWSVNNMPLYQGDVAAVTKYGFDSIKLDGCGTEWDLGMWARLLNASGRRVMIENCHWGWTVPSNDWCPWNMFRTSGDVRASYGSVVGNLQSTIPWAEKGASRPGCWAYPDALEVGCQHGPGGDDDRGLSFVEMRSHFGAWVIISSPLVLSLDVNNDTIMDAVWPVIANKEAIAVNQAWAGHSGSPFKSSNTNVKLDDFNSVVMGEVRAHEGSVPSWQYFHKPIGDGKVAVLLMNHAPQAQRLHLRFREVPGLQGSSARVRDVWTHEDLGDFESEFATRLESHDSAFLVLSASAATAPAASLLV